MITYHNKPGLLLYRPSDPQHYYNTEAEYVDDWIHFDVIDEDFDKKVNELAIPFNKVLDVPNLSDISSIHQQIAAEHFKQSKSHAKIMDHLLRALLYRLSDELEDKPVCVPSSMGNAVEMHKARFDALRRRIYQGGEAARLGSVENMAAELHFSTSYFQHIYKALYGVSVKHDLIIAKVEYASYLLLNYDQNIESIARECGYESVEHFNRQFKKIKKMAPTEYRKTNR